MSMGVHPDGSSDRHTAAHVLANVATFARRWANWNRRCPGERPSRGLIGSFGDWFRQPTFWRT